MSNTKVSEVRHAIDALSTALSVVEQQLAGKNDELTRLSRKRRDFLNDTAETLLPSISTSVLERLRNDVRSFVDARVEKSFSTWRKVWGLFPRPGTADALNVLRSQLIAHLSKSKFGLIGDLDSLLDSLRREQAELDEKSRQMRELLQSLHDLARSKAPVPEALASHIERLGSYAGRSSKFYSTSYARYRTAGDVALQSSFSTTSAASSSSDDSDIWIYMLTDIPTSFRTLVADAVVEHGKHRQAESFVELQSQYSKPSYQETDLLPSRYGLSDPVGFSQREESDDRPVSFFDRSSTGTSRSRDDDDSSTSRLFSPAYEPDTVSKTSDSFVCRASESSQSDPGGWASDDSTDDGSCSAGDD